MWVYALSSAGIVALISWVAPMLGSPDATSGTIDGLHLGALLPAGVGLAVRAMRARREAAHADDAEQPEFAGNVPVGWTMPTNAEFAPVQPCPNRAAQPIFLSPLRPGADTALLLR